MAKKSLLAMGLLFVVTLACFSAWAVPNRMNYQGRLTDSDGNPLTGTYNMTFYFFTAQSGGSAIWSENHPSVQVTDGIYSVQLGSLTPNLFENNELYLEVEVGGETLVPRQQITSTAFSMKAGDADTVAGLTPPEIVATSHTHDGTEITGTIAEDRMPDTIARIWQINWDELDNIPVGFADGVDDTGITTEADPWVPSSLKDGVSWSEVSGRPSGLDDGDDVGITSESDPQVGSNTTNRVPKWNGSALVTGSLCDNGNVGIGDSSPIAELGFGGFPPFPFIDVDRVHIWRTGDLACGFGVMPGLFMQYVPEDAHIGWGTRSTQGVFTEKMRFEGPSGNLGIGVFDPTEKLDVNGNARFRNIGGGTPPLYPLSVDSNGVLTAAYPSDRRLKTNIVNIEDGLKIVEKLQGVRFNWKEDAEGKRRIGLIAQDVEKVVPELTFTNPVDGYMGINYAELSAVLIEAVKEQQQTIEKLTLRVDELETTKRAEIESLKDQLTHLQELVETLIAQQGDLKDNNGRLSMKTWR
jgi:hypothetical protein